MKRTIGVIIPTFNRASYYLPKAIESVLSQKFRDSELIVVDDGSSDNTKDVVSGFGKKVIYLRQKNKGPAAARNLGIKTSKGKYLAFLDSDDWWDRQKLALQIEQMQKNSSYLISHTQEIWYKNGKLLSQKKKHKKFAGFIFNKCLPLCAVSLSTAIVKKELFEKIGLFDESLPCCEDYDFWLRTSIRHPFLLIDKPLTLKDGGRPDQVSSIYGRGMDKFRIQSIIKILKNNDLSKKQQKLAIAELKNKCRIYGNGCIKHGKVKEAKYYLELPLSFSPDLR